MRARFRLKRFGPWLLGVGLAPPGTVWWILAARVRARHDLMFGLSRDYMRDLGMYVWSFHAGRIKLCASLIPKDMR